ncbi:MAG TPA: hypothetical protein DEQ40_04160 [Oxalobacteraceae bacterium]|nr:hypothetical protein [Oxalobacteraceae bacterium]
MPLAKMHAILLYAHIFLTEFGDAPSRQGVGAMIEEHHRCAEMQMPADFQDAYRVGQQLINHEVQLVEVEAGRVTKGIDQARIHHDSLPCSYS